MESSKINQMVKTKTRIKAGIKSCSINQKRKVLITKANRLLKINRKVKLKITKIQKRKKKT